MDETAEMEIRTVSIPDAADYLRKLGIRISPETLRDGIEQGKFPFGVCIRTRSGNPVYLIYQTLLEQWIFERATPHRA